MMLNSLHNLNATTQTLRLSVFLQSIGGSCNASGGILSHFILREQGRKPSGIIWVDSLFGMGNGKENRSYAPANNNDVDSADETRKRCRSHSERFHT